MNSCVSLLGHIVHFHVCFVCNKGGGGRVGCQLVHAVRLHCSTSTPSAVRKSLVYLVRSSGQLVPGQLHGCRVAGKEPFLGKPSRGYFICSAVTHPPPSSPLFSISSQLPYTSSAESSRRDSWLMLPERGG